MPRNSARNALAKFQTMTTTHRVIRYTQLGYHHFHHKTAAIRNKYVFQDFPTATI